MSSRILGLFKFLLFILLLPFLTALSMSFFRSVGGSARFHAWFLRGMGGFLILQLFVAQLNPVFDFGRKLLKDIFSFSTVSAAVIPNIVPFYTVLGLIVFYLCRRLLGWTSGIEYWVFFTAFTLTMHMVLTAGELYSEDGGLFKAHYFFNMSLIYIAVLLLTAGLLSFSFKAFRFIPFIKTALSISKYLYTFSQEHLSF